MDFSLSEEQQLLKDSVDRFVRDNYGLAERRKLVASPDGFSIDHWRAMADHPGLDALAIAVPPRLQPEIAVRALKAGKAVFLEKPLAANLEGAHAVREQAVASGRPVMIDFEFCELPHWQRATTIPTWAVG